MDKGAFALVDCLGFKGLWKKGHDPLISKLRSINETLDNDGTNLILPERVKDHSINVKSLSDTIAISVSSLNGEKDAFNELIILSGIVFKVIQLFVEIEPHLLLRGCITYDEFLTEKNFLIGPAVDSTAEFMDSAQGAFIWCLPSAADVIDNYCTNRSIDMKPKSANDIILRAINSLLPRYEVPIKDAHYLKTRIVSHIYNKSNEDSEKFINKAKSVMNVQSMSVWMKRQYTLEFLEFCKVKNSELHEITIVG